MSATRTETLRTIRNKGAVLGQLLLSVAVLAMTVIFILPYISLLLTSLKPPTEVFRVPPSLIPSTFSMESYVNVGEYLPIGRYFFNSIVATGFSTVLSLLIGGLAAYRLSRVKTRFNNLFLLLTLSTRMIPAITIAIPVYGLVGRLGLMDTRAALVFAYACLNVPFVIWLMVGFFDSVPKELDEAARVDGCSSLSAFFRIIVPISISGFATTAIFSFMLAWNDFLFALLLTSIKSKTIPIGISEFMSVYNLNWGPMSAAAIMFSLPVLIMTFTIQKRIVEGLTLGAVKG